METEPGVRKSAPLNLIEALELVDAPLRVEIPSLPLADGLPAAVHLRQQDNLSWARHQQVYPMLTKPAPSIVEDPGLALERDRQWNEMAWAMCKVAVFEMEACIPDGDGFRRKWVPVRLVEDGARERPNDLEFSRFKRCMGLCFNRLIEDFNTLQGVRLDEPVFRESGDEDPHGPVVGDGGEVQAVTP